MTRRLFVPAEKWIGTRVTIEGEPHRHVARVLRARAGDKLTLFDGHGGEADAEVLAIERDQTTLSLGARRQVAAPAGPRVVLLQSLARGEKMDWIVQKTTELGVREIVPVAAERSTVRLSAAEAAARRTRWEKIAREAARQCGRADVPTIAPAVAFAEAVDAPRAAGDLRLALWEGSQGRPMRAALTESPAMVTLLIGPEGGLGEPEVARAERAGFQIVGLGPRILRVETAAITAVALVQSATGGLD
jgi:16S rRNA (uracil1498-N3)-methyltransferase